MTDFFIYVLSSAFFLAISFLSAKLIMYRINSTFWVILYLLFNIAIGEQQYSIAFNAEYSYNYPISLEVTDIVRLTSLCFLILSSVIIMQPFRLNNKITK